MTSSSFRRAIPAVWENYFLLFLVLWLLVPDAYRGAVAPGSLHGYDFNAAYNGASRLRQGLPLYDGSGYVYSPLLAILLRPLAALPFEKAMQFWALLNIGFLLAAAAMFAHAARFSRRDGVAGAIILLTGFHFWPSIFNLGLGQLNFIILLLLCALFAVESKAFEYSISQKKSRDSLSIDTPSNDVALRRGLSRSRSKGLSKDWSRDLMWAILLSLAILFKTWMLGLLVYLVIARRWRAVVACLGVYVASLAFLFLFIGAPEFAGFVRDTRHYAVQADLVSHSIPGFAALHFQSNPQGIKPFVDSATASHAFVALGFAVVAGGWWALWKWGEARSLREAHLRLGFVVSSILLLSTLCHIEYFVLCLPLLWTFLAPAHESKWRISLPLVAGCALVYIAFTRPQPYFIGEFAGYQHGLKSLLISLPLFANAALWLLTLAAISQTRKQRDTGLGESEDLALQSSTRSINV